MKGGNVGSQLIEISSHGRETSFFFNQENFIKKKKKEGKTLSERVLVVHSIIFHEWFVSCHIYTQVKIKCMSAIED